MKNNTNYHQSSTKIFMYGNSNNKENEVTENFSDQEILPIELENEFEKQNAFQNGDTLTHEIWGDNFVSDSLH